MCKMSLITRKGKIMITKVSYRPYASGVNNTQNQPKKVNFGAHSPQEVGEKLAHRLANLTGSGSRGAIVQDMLATLSFLKEHCGLPDEIYTAAVKRTSQLRVRSLWQRIFGG